MNKKNNIKEKLNHFIHKYTCTSLIVTLIAGICLGIPIGKIGTISQNEYSAIMSKYNSEQITRKQLEDEITQLKATPSPTPTPTPSPTPSPTPKPTPTPTPTPVPTVRPTEQPTTVPKAQTQPSGSNETASQTVYITKTGKKYHRAGCQYLKQSKISISLKDAKASGYTPCSKCY